MKKTAHYGDTVTLHYRLRSVGGAEIASTFGDEPVKLTLGAHELAENLERCVVGLPVNERHIFRLDAAHAFGACGDPSLVQRIPLADIPRSTQLDEDSLIEFTLPNGQTLTGRVLGLSGSHVTVDFNHPLCGCDVVFEVELIDIA